MGSRASSMSYDAHAGSSSPVGGCTRHHTQTCAPLPTPPHYFYRMGPSAVTTHDQPHPPRQLQARTARRRGNEPLRTRTPPCPIPPATAGCSASNRARERESEGVTGQRERPDLGCAVLVHVVKGVEPVHVEGSTRIRAQRDTQVASLCSQRSGHVFSAPGTKGTWMVGDLQGTAQARTNLGGHEDAQQRERVNVKVHPIALVGQNEFAIVRRPRAGGIPLARGCGHKPLMFGAHPQHTHSASTHRSIGACCAESARAGG